MKAYVYYNSDNQEEINAFVTLTTKHMNTVLEQRKGGILRRINSGIERLERMGSEKTINDNGVPEFRTKENSNFEHVPFKEWFNALADHQPPLALDKILVKDRDNNPVNTDDHPFYNKLDAARQVFMYIESNQSRMDSNSVTSAATIEPMTPDSLERKHPSSASPVHEKTQSLATFTQHLAELKQKADEFLNKQQPSSHELRAGEIALELCNQLLAIQKSWIENTITLEHFKKQCQELIQGDLTLELEKGKPAEKVNVRTELSRHTEWSFMCILDNILWFLDIYRLFTGKRLFTFAEPPVMKDLRNIENDVENSLPQLKAS